MKSISLSVPANSFPAVVGERVRIRVGRMRGRDSIDAKVLSVRLGCGAADSVLLQYDDSLLVPNQKSLNQCQIEGFRPLADCCSARMCSEIFGPDSNVLVGEYHAMHFASDFRLDRVKIYSTHPTVVPLALNIVIDGVNLTSMPIVFTGESVTLNRVGFASSFASGEIAESAMMHVDIISAPTSDYYGTPWTGLTVCVVGQWLPYSSAPKPARVTTVRTFSSATTPVPAPVTPPATGHLPSVTYVTGSDGAIYAKVIGEDGTIKYLPTFDTLP